MGVPIEQAPVGYKRPKHGFCGLLWGRQWGLWVCPLSNLTCTVKGALFTVSSSRLNAFPGQCGVWVSALKVQSLERSLYRAACFLAECLEQRSILL